MDVNDLAGFQFDDHEYEYVPEKDIVSLHKITRPDFGSTFAHEGGPGLSAWSQTRHPFQILLDRALAHLNPQFERDSPIRSAPHERLSVASCQISRIVVTDRVAG